MLDSERGGKGECLRNSGGQLVVIVVRVLQQRFSIVFKSYDEQYGTRVRIFADGRKMDSIASKPGRSYTLHSVPLTPTTEAPYIFSELQLSGMCACQRASASHQPFELTREL